MLVSTDLIGQLPSAPRFVKPRADVYGAVVGAASEYVAEVRGAGAGVGVLGGVQPAAAAAGGVYRAG